MAGPLGLHFTHLKAITLLVLLFASTGQAALKPVHLRCEYLEEPIGIDKTAPRLSWQLESKERAQKQSAYQIQVASSEAKLKKNEGDLWDTSKISSDESTQIAYAGKPLES